LTHDFEGKVALLRRYERRVYAICFYVIGDEQRALRASEDALIELFQAAAFASGSAKERSRLSQAAALRHARKQIYAERGFSDARAHG
jgi:hypothetical protein